MEHVDNILNTISLSMGVAWASGINLYATILVLGLMGTTGNMVLPQGLEVLTDPMVIGAAGLMYMVEFFADKTPGVDTGWDAIHSFIRIPAGVVLAAASTGEVDPALLFAAAIAGGFIATGSHMAKSGSRVLINTSPEPFTNWTASIAEDIAVIAGLWTALNHPLAFIIFLIIFLAALIWLLPKIWKGIKKVFGYIKGMAGKKPSTPSNFYEKPLLDSDNEKGVEEKLDTLNTLLEKKHISREEFELKRKEILDSI